MSVFFRMIAVLLVASRSAAGMEQDSIAAPSTSLKEATTPPINGRTIVVASSTGFKDKMIISIGGGTGARQHLKQVAHFGYYVGQTKEPCDSACLRLGLGCDKDKMQITDDPSTTEAFRLVGVTCTGAITAGVASGTSNSAPSYVPATATPASGVCTKVKGAGTNEPSLCNHVPAAAGVRRLCYCGGTGAAAIVASTTNKWMQLFTPMSREFDIDAQIVVLPETFLTSTVAKGATRLPVNSIAGFTVGDVIHVGTDSSIERSTITGFVSITEMSCTALVNDHGKTDPVVFVAKASEAASCFPGSATALVSGRGPIQLSALDVGDNVLVSVFTAGAPQFEYQPVTSFLHAVKSPASQFQEVRAIVHSRGILHATNGHLVFVERRTPRGTGGSVAVPAADIRPGDRIFVAGTSGTAPELSTVMRVHREFTNTGMFGPFTSAGSIVIDGVVVSNYATPSLNLWLPHGAAHASFFFLRAFHAIGCSTAAALFSSSLDARHITAEEMHPFVGTMFNTLRFDKLMVQR